jgi:protease secretion system outer membrane protein
MHPRIRMRALALCIATLAACPVGALTLPDAWRAALGNDAQYRASRHELESARQDLPITRASLLPSVNFSASTSKVRGRREFANGLSQEVEVPLDYQAPQASLQLRAPLINFDALARTRQAYVSVEAAEQTFLAREADLALRLIGAYLQVVAASDDRVVAAGEVQALQGQLERQQRRHQQGEGTLTEIARTQAALDGARVRVLDAELALAVATRALRRITGVDSPMLSRPGADFSLLTTPYDRMEDWFDLALRNNPALKARELAITVALRAADRAKAGHMPRMDLVASVSQSRNESPTNVNQTTQTRSLGVQLSVPIYSGGGVEATIRQALAERDRAEEALRADREAVLLDVERAYRAVSGAQEKLQAYQRALQASQTELRGATRSQELGQGTVAEVLDARTRLSAAQRDLAQARLAYLENRMKLLLSSGEPPESVLDDLSRVMTEEVTIQPSPSK